ncbi:MAG: hypothetical protein QOH87_2923, partial [Trebonia sp.]|nr:hypothetical protein [Trebonia sp.]
MDRGRAAETAALTRQIHQVREQFDEAPAAEVERLIYRLDEDPGVARALRRSSPGCLWLLGRWGLLGARLQERQCLEPSERHRAIALMGKQTGDLFEDHWVMRWNAAYVGALVGGEDGSGADAERVGAILGGDIPEGMGVGEFRRRIEALAATAPGADRGHATLKAMVAEAVAELSERLELVEAREDRDRELAVRIAAFDGSAEGAKRLRYEMAHERVLRASLRDLRALQKARSDGWGEAATGDDAAPTEAKPEGGRVETFEAASPECRDI